MRNPLKKKEVPKKEEVAEEVKVEEKKACSNCNDSGRTCIVCRVGLVV